MADWRFHLLTLPDGEWIDRDLQLEGAQVIEALSAPASLSGRLPLGYRMINSPSGKRALVEWGSAIVAEQEGRDPIFAIVDELSTDGDWLNVSAGGFSSYPTGMPWTDGQYSSTKVDALDVVRLIWARLQNKPGGDLGVVVDSVKSGVFLGKPEDPKLTAAKADYELAKQVLGFEQSSAENMALMVNDLAGRPLTLAGLPKTGRIIYAANAPSGESRSKSNLWLEKLDGGVVAAYTWNGKKWVEIPANLFDPVTDAFFEYELWRPKVAESKGYVAGAKKIASESKAAMDALREGEAVPYTLSWWDTHDLGSLISDLAVQTPFEYREQTSWAGDDALSHRLVIGCPSFGVRREDLRLEIGVNVTSPPPLNESEYASEVLVLGAGEGRTMVTATANADRGRLRRVVVVERKDFAKSAQAQAVARTEVAARDAEWAFDSFSLVDHPMCPYGSFDVGDWLYLTGDAGWAQLEQWVRVLEIQIDCTTGGLSLKVGST